MGVDPVHDNGRRPPSFTTQDRNTGAYVVGRQMPNNVDGGGADAVSRA
jgi:hypothetical protein